LGEVKNIKPPWGEKISKQGGGLSGGGGVNTQKPRKGAAQENPTGAQDQVRKEVESFGEQKQ